MRRVFPFRAGASIREKMDCPNARGPWVHPRWASRRPRCQAAKRRRSKLSTRGAANAYLGPRRSYILDEPTQVCISKTYVSCLEVLHELVDQGNSVGGSFIETQPRCDPRPRLHQSTFGPEGADGGGQVVRHWYARAGGRGERSYTVYYPQADAAKRKVAAELVGLGRALSR